MTSAKLPILSIGLDSGTEKLMEDLLRKCDLRKQPLDMDALLNPVVPVPAIVLSGMPKGEIKANELAQALRMHYPQAVIYLISTERARFEREDALKNGFTDAFLLPIELPNLINAFSDTLARVNPGLVQWFKPVKLIDVEGGQVLEFDTNLFLPANNKYVKLSNAGEALDTSRIEKIKKSKFNNVYVPAEQMPKFYSYSAKKLRDLGAGTFSVTERKEKLSQAVRELISGLFTEQSSTFESGQAVLRDCGEIVKTYILQGADSEWYARILTVLGEKGDSYSHAGNTSTLAALFSMGLGIGKPDDLALAGLLHDIGIAELPPEVQVIEPHEMSKTQLAAYQKHPELSVQMIKSRKLIVPEIVMKAILQHHEVYNGTGYPSGLFGDRICKEAQVLALANTFDYLTCLKPGQPMLTPTEAVEKLREEQVNDPAKIKFNPEILKKLLTLFPNPKANP